MSPKGFGDDKRAQIRRLLMEVGRRHFERFGLKKTNISELARECGIAKGSFYLFFASKEELFFEILGEVQDEVRAPMLDELHGGGRSPQEVFRDFLKRMLLGLDHQPLLGALTDPETLSQLMRKLPQEKIAEHRRGDEAVFGELIAQWQDRGIFIQKDPRVVFGILSAMVLTTLNRDFIGDEVFGEVIETLVDFVCDGLFSPGSNS